MFLHNTNFFLIVLWPIFVELLVELLGDYPEESFLILGL
jgi:hypothetical protein